MSNLAGTEHTFEIPLSFLEKGILVSVCAGVPQPFK